MKIKPVKLSQSESIEEIHYSRYLEIKEKCGFKKNKVCINKKMESDSRLCYEGSCPELKKEIKKLFH